MSNRLGSYFSTIFLGMAICLSVGCDRDTKLVENGTSNGAANFPQDCSSLECNKDAELVENGTSNSAADFPPNCSGYKIPEEFNQADIKKYSQIQLDGFSLHYSICDVNSNIIISVLEEGVRRKNPESMYTLGTLLYDGMEFEDLHLKKNRARSIALFREAAKLGEESSISRLKHIE